MMRSDRALAEWVDAARTELPALRDGLRAMERNGEREAAAVMRVEMELLQSVLRRYTMLEDGDLAGTEAQLHLLESIHNGMTQFAQNPIRRRKGPKQPYRSKALAGLDKLMRGIRGDAA